MGHNDCGVIINGNHTDIVVKYYGNRICIVITQFEKFGSVISVTRETSIDQYKSDIYSTQLIFGKDTDENHVSARYIAEAIKIEQPLLLILALKDYEISTLQKITEIINKIKAW